MTTSAAPETLPSFRLSRQLALSDFPWDSLTPYREWTAQHLDGVADLAVGTSVDPTPEIARNALLSAVNVPGYPTAVSVPVVRAAVTEQMERCRGVAGFGDDEVIPTIGSKESVAPLPPHLGVHPGDLVLHPRAAYPTYDIDVRLVGATPVSVDIDADPVTWDIAENAPIVVVWLSSPGNSDGHVLSVEQMARIVAWTWVQGAVIISDECYAELGWEAPRDTQLIPSLLDPRVEGAEGRSGPFALYPLLKQSNLAGYRAAFLTGDVRLVGAITEMRKHIGTPTPTPVQAALVAALGDEAHIEVQKEVYRERREVLVEVTATVGFVNDPASVAGLYLRLRGSELMSAYELAGTFVEFGIVVAPGDLYDEVEAGRVHMNPIDTDERVAAIVARLRSPEATALFAG